MPANPILDELINMSRELGRPDSDCVILGEGNTSARASDSTFFVKASGTRLEGIGGEDFVEVRFENIQDILSPGELSEEKTGQLLLNSRVKKDGEIRPSVETLLHAICLQQEGVHFVGHTHPTTVNALTCSASFEQLCAGRLFPDEVVVCGRESLLIPYIDPGLTLGRQLDRRIKTFVRRRGAPPKVILMQNHGMVALGKTARDVVNITMMTIKAARIRLGAAQTGGGIRPMPESEVERIANRLDEHYRQRKLEE
jgi:rhamnose utilization protein RhaD (predicted bifunctional aldolase and dehydrogenase)